MYSDKKFSTAHMATLGLDFVSKVYTPPGTTNKDMQVKIWDTAGQERFRTLTLSFYKQAQGVILTFDVTNITSFKNVKMWLESIYQYADDNVAKILVGNKIDMVDDRKISEQEAREMAQQHNMTYYEASAMKNINIDEFMNDLMNQVYIKKFSTPESEIKRPTFKLKDGQPVGGDGGNNGGKKKGCCK